MCIRYAVEKKYNRIGYRLFEVGKDGKYYTLFNPICPIEKNVRVICKFKILPHHSALFGFFSSKKLAEAYKSVLRKNAFDCKLIVKKIKPVDVYEGVSDTSYGWHIKHPRTLGCKIMTIID